MTISISQSTANDFFIEFFKQRNAPAKFAELAEALTKKFQANSNQISGLIHRAHAKDSILIKNGKEYSLNTNVNNNSSIIHQVKTQIATFKKELDKGISLNDVSSSEEFKELKDLLKKLEELSR
ncbi:hypothetical protein [Bacillus sp. FJAT-26390]|uniref:hypothetical protein n=1 Tax=Bacillus sp. FJAT-26390 TaxID=1743142 RepID=UPI000807BA99|nr:hypothetical protein [Bacillus sp. FJAT-26390]OBZ10264.1 hypothetical protein A7975_23225 [Bacillus sp. FJAT-26390]